MCEVKGVAPGCDNPLIELCGRGRSAGTGKQHATYLLFFIERAGYGEEFDRLRAELLGLDRPPEGAP